MSKKMLAISLVLLMTIIGAIGCTGDLTFPETPAASPEGGVVLSQQNTGIWVTGEGKVSVTPDVAILNLGVEAQAATVAEAQQQAVEAMEAIMDALDDYDIAEKDIKTQHFSIQPVRRWDNGKETLVGYRVTNTLSVKIRNMEDAGSLIDAATAAGGDYTRINNISFVVDDPTAYHEEAREKAMADAEAKAEQLASLAGVSLGRPTYINESGGFTPLPYDYYLRAEGAPAPEPTTPISPGETEIRLTVQVIYSIE